MNVSNPDRITEEIGNGAAAASACLRLIGKTNDVIYDVMWVLDSNILVAGLHSRRGASFWLLDRVVSGRLPIAVSVALALEYEDVLGRPDLHRDRWASKMQVDAVLDSILANARLVQPIHFQKRPALRDPDDDMVLECAAGAQARGILTMNARDFAGVFERFGIEILKPGELVARLREEEG